MNKLIADGIYFLAQKARGENVYRGLAELDKKQWLSCLQVEHLQKKRVEEILRYSLKNVPFYREKLTGVKDFQGLEKIPLLTHEKVRDNIDLLISKEYSRAKLLKYHSSGSTGEPLTLYFQPEAIGYFHAAQYRGFSWYGLDPTDKCVKLWGVPLKFIPATREALKDFVMNRKRISAFEMSEKSMEKYYKTCKQFKPAFLYGYASALYRFAQYLKDNNKAGRPLDLKVIIPSSEILYGHQRQLLEETFGCKVANEYGTAEVGIIAFECPQGGMHITSENVYVELLRDGKPVKEGETGEVVVTGLRNYAMPLIRYKLGDLATHSARSCPCGRGLPLLESIQGRNNDMVVTSDGKVLHSEIFAYINRDLIGEGFLVKEFKIIQKARDKLKVLVLKGIKEDTIEAMRRKIEERVGRNIKIDIEAVEKIPLEKSGKVRYFTSELSNT